MKRLILFSSLLCIVLISCRNPQKENASGTYGNPKTQKVPDDAISITYSDHLYFQLNFDSIKGNYLFDTGADGIYYDSIFYYENQFNHKNISLGCLPGVGLNTQFVKVVFDTIKFKLKDRNFTTRISPIINLKQIVGDFADGIIGGRLFNDLVMEINYDNEYVKIYTSIDSVDTKSYEKIKLSRVKNRYYLPLSVKINDSLVVTGDFLLDLGSGGSVSFTNFTSTKYNFASNIGFKIPFYSKYAGIGGESSSFDFMSDSLSIGRFKLNNVVMDYSIDKTGAMSKGKYVGILGNEVLEKFDIIIDNINDDLYLKPNSKINEPFRFSTKGFSYVDRNHTKGAWIVTGIYKESNAEKAGLKIDDKIIKVNNIDVSTMQLKERKTIWQQADFVELTIKNNDSIINKIKFELALSNNNR